MDYNLAHALFGRFGVLIPLLGLFFELAGVITKKKLVMNIAGSIVIFGSIIVLLAGITGLIWLKSLYQFHSGNISLFKLHYILGGFLTFFFLIIGSVRGILFRKESELLSVFYIFAYVIFVMLNLFDNEFIAHSIYSHQG